MGVEAPEILPPSPGLREPGRVQGGITPIRILGVSCEQFFHTLAPDAIPALAFKTNDLLVGAWPLRV
jgi:hypothetical protein